MSPMCSARVTSATGATSRISAEVEAPSVMPEKKKVKSGTAKIGAADSGAKST
jgi:hypothetical protein